MAIDFQKIFNDINKQVIDQNKPNVFGGSNRAEGALKGQQLETSGRGVCNVLHWACDNIGYNIYPDIQFRPEGAFIGWEVYDKNGELVYRHSRTGFSGDHGQSDPAQAIHELGKRIVIAFAQYARNNIKV